MWLCILRTTDLNNHLAIHTGEKSKKCNQCNYATSRASNLRKHLKTHNWEKSNKYNQCGYVSSLADVLKEHLKTHSGEKSNKCNQCDYVSSQAAHLRTHLKTHSGEKSNSTQDKSMCVQCIEINFTVNNMKTHLKNYDGWRWLKRIMFQLCCISCCIVHDLVPFQQIHFDQTRATIDTNWSQFIVSPPTVVTICLRRFKAGADTFPHISQIILVPFEQIVALNSNIWRN